MPEKNSNKKIKELLDAWISGDFSQEQHEILKQAASADPFLSDALEGLSFLSPSERKAHLNHLRTLLNEHQSRKKRKRIVWWQYSAAAAVLLFIGFWFMLRPVDNFSETLASDEPQKTEVHIEPFSIDDKSKMVDSFPAEQENSVIAEAPIKSFSKKAESKPDEKRTIEIPEPPPAIASAPSTPEEDMIAEVETEEFKNTEQEIQLDQTPIITKQKNKDENRNGNALTSPTQSQDQRYLPTEKKKRTTSKISGTVMDLQGDQIIAAAIQIVGTTEGVISDFNGNFEIEIPNGDSESEIDLLVTYIGYRDQIVSASPGENITILLESDNQVLDEVVVAGYGDSEESGSQKVHLVNPTPLVGKKMYNSYLKSNLIYPEEAREQKIEGNVKVEFLINSKGKPYNLKIKKGLGYGCDEEAIRLIREGPDWDFGPEFKNKRQWKVQFKLP